MMTLFSYWCLMRSPASHKIVKSSSRSVRLRHSMQGVSTSFCGHQWTTFGDLWHYSVCYDLGESWPSSFNILGKGCEAQESQPKPLWWLWYDGFFFLLDWTGLKGIDHPRINFFSCFLTFKLNKINLYFIGSLPQKSYVTLYLRPLSIEP